MLNIKFKQTVKFEEVKRIVVTALVSSFISAVLIYLVINIVKDETHTAAPLAEVINPCDSLVASQQASINTINDDYKRLLILVGKYEMALDAIRYTDHEAYRQFIRHAQFAEQYTAEREDEFYKENLKYK